LFNLAGDWPGNGLAVGGFFGFTVKQNGKFALPVGWTNFNPNELVYDDAPDDCPWALIMIINLKNLFDILQNRFIMKKTVFVCTSLFAFLIFFSACGPTLKVTNDYDKSANFQQYKTFRIVKLEQQYQTLSSLNQDRIINAVRSQMIQKGFTELENPDLLVNIVVILKAKSQLVANSYGYGGGYRPYYWGGGNMSTTVDVQTYTDGSLVVEVADAKTKKLLWEGAGNKEIDSPSKNPDKDIPAAVSMIMASFPPGATAKK
jgi:Domain of unknown function (DUF4136)